MVTRKRLRSILTALGLYVLATLLIGYFGVNAFGGNHGLKAKQDLELQIATLSTELGQLKLERKHWERRIALLKSRVQPVRRWPAENIGLDETRGHDLGAAGAV